MGTVSSAGVRPSCDLDLLWLEITPKCNLECRHCYAESSPRRSLFGDMTLQDWLRVLSEAAQLGCRHVQFIGGEPTLHPQLSDMVAAAAAHDYEFIEVFTNATGISTALLETFVRSGVHVATSFYSDDPNIHDSITRRRGSFVRTVVNIRRLIAAGIHVRAGIIEMEQNAGHVANAERFLGSLGVNDISIDSARPVGRASGSLSRHDPMSALCGQCWSGKLCVTASGTAYPCVFSRFADLGTVAGQELHKLMIGEKLTAFRTSLKNRLTSGETSASAPEECLPEHRCPPTCTPRVFPRRPPTRSTRVPTAGVGYTL
jgi:MoaA/NifB/PqqE/SkfB family radical SAM enzyme